MQMWYRLLAAAFMSFALASCGSSDADTLTVLAGSELEDLTPLLSDIRRETGVEIKISYTGTLEGTERIMGGDQSDAAWFSHNKYLALLQGNARRILAQEKIMLSPVIIGVKESDARKWGWVDKAPSWRDIADKAASGELRYAMTNPAASNSGFSAIIAVTTAFANKGDALSEADVKNTDITRFFKGQQLTSGSSGWLSDAFFTKQGELNGMVNYESVLMQLNQSGKLKERLALIYPAEGVISADYPLMLLNEKKRKAYEKVVEYLRSPAVQTRIMNETQRRPIVPQVKPAAMFGNALVIELPFPGRYEIIDSILFAYLDQHRRPAHVYFVLDVSGSMTGDRLVALQTAFHNLTGQDRTLTGKFARFGSREKITVITFSSEVQAVKQFEIVGAVESATAIAELRTMIDSMQASGMTGIYSALQRAYDLAKQDAAADKGRAVSVVIMTDGENNQGISPSGFVQYYRALPSDIQGVRTFPILFGEGKESEMKLIAETTAGRVFDGRKSLIQAFKAIRGYQ